MNLKLSHVAIAVPEIRQIAERLKALALQVAETHHVETEKVVAAMIPVEVSSEFRIELLEPSESGSALAKFLEKRPAGGMHHLSFEVSNLQEWKKVLEKNGFEILPPGIRKAARGMALFIHPRSIGGVLVELEEIQA
ncbi:MAG: VOC family protein [Bdellovibrionales bacterium]|nr:VOC family protein [Bdellovibrionales bacterium]